MNKIFRKAAESRGYTVFYDRSLRLWAVTKEGVETNYLTAYILQNKPVYKLMELYLPE